MKAAIVKYNAGNIYSVVNALRRMGIEPLLTDVAEELQQADCVLFPGQGEARGAMEYLKARRLDEVIRNLKQPVLGICVGQRCCAVIPRKAMWIASACLMWMLSVSVRNATRTRCRLWDGIHFTT